MKVEREVIIDLLPAYFSGEASAATRTLVEEYFREHPDFEKAARSANDPLETLKVPLSALNEAKEKLALERARQIGETRTAYLWLAIFFTLFLFFFQIQDHHIVFLWWQKSPYMGVAFTAAAIFLWFAFFKTLGRKEPLSPATQFLWLAVFYTLGLGLFTISNHKIVWLILTSDRSVPLTFGGVALALWISYFYQRWKTKRMQS